MNTDRRSAIKNFVLLYAGIVLIPACLQQKGKPSIVLKNIDIGSDDEKFLEEFCETFIPGNATPGAKDIGAHLFVLKMVDDCVSKDNQQQFIKGMAEFEKMAVKTTGASFNECIPAQRIDLFNWVESKKAVSPDLTAFYNLVKKYTIQAYTTSKYFLTKVQLYELMPARFHGCVPIDKKTV